MNIKIEYIRGELQECDCCGIYSSEGTSVYVDNELVWERYSDGHLYGRQTEKSILKAIVDAWLQKSLKEIEETCTEECRLDWNKKYPGNGIARTQESWEEYKQEKIKYCLDSVNTIIENCHLLPYNEGLQVRMIALWIEDVTGEHIEVDEEQVLDTENKTVNQSDFILEEHWD